MCEALLPFSGADLVSLRIEDSGKTTWCRATQKNEEDPRVEMGVVKRGLLDFEASDEASDAIPEPVLQAILGGGFAAPVQSFS